MQQRTTFYKKENLCLTPFLVMYSCRFLLRWPSKTMPTLWPDMHPYVKFTGWFPLLSQILMLCRVTIPSNRPRKSRRKSWRTFSRLVRTLSVEIHLRILVYFLFLQIGAKIIKLGSENYQICRNCFKWTMGIMAYWKILNLTWFMNCIADKKTSRV